MRVTVADPYSNDFMYFSLKPQVYKEAWRQNSQLRNPPKTSEKKVPADVFTCLPQASGRFALASKLG